MFLFISFDFDNHDSNQIKPVSYTLENEEILAVGRIHADGVFDDGADKSYSGTIYHAGGMIKGGLVAHIKEIDDGQFDEARARVAQRLQKAKHLYITETNDEAEELQKALDLYDHEGIAASAGEFGRIKNWQGYWEEHKNRFSTIRIVAPEDAAKAFEEQIHFDGAKVCYHKPCFPIDSQERFNEFIRSGINARDKLLKDAEEKLATKKQQAEDNKLFEEITTQEEWETLDTLEPFETLATKYASARPIAPSTITFLSLVAWLNFIGEKATFRYKDMIARPYEAIILIGEKSVGKSTAINLVTERAKQFGLDESRLDRERAKEKGESSALVYTLKYGSAAGLENMLAKNFVRARDSGRKHNGASIICHEAQNILTSTRGRGYTLGEWGRFSEIYDRTTNDGIVVGRENSFDSFGVVEYQAGFILGIQPDCFTCVDDKKLDGQGFDARCLYAAVPYIKGRDIDGSLDGVFNPYNELFNAAYDRDDFGEYSFSDEALKRFKEWERRLKKRIDDAHRTPIFAYLNRLKEHALKFVLGLAVAREIITHDNSKKAPLEIAEHAIKLAEASLVDREKALRYIENWQSGAGVVSVTFEKKLRAIQKYLIERRLKGDRWVLLSDLRNNVSAYRARKNGEQKSDLQTQILLLQTLLDRGLIVAENGEKNAEKIVGVYRLRIAAALTDQDT